MIHFYTGARTRLLTVKKKLESHFLASQSQEGLFVFKNMEKASLEEIRQALQGLSFFSSKKLIILDGYPFSIGETFPQSSEKEHAILEILSQTSADPDILVLCLSENPDKRGKAYKTLIQISNTHKNLAFAAEKDVFLYFSQKYTTAIDANALHKLIQYKAGDPGKVEQEIEKLRIRHDSIDLHTVEQYISPEFEQSIFLFVDSILSKNSKDIFSLFQNISQHANFYVLYQSILANLRVYLYISYLKSEKKNTQEITDILNLGKRAFIIGKAHASHLGELTELYQRLIRIDTFMKTGQYPSSQENFLFSQIEQELLIYLQK